jgi:hypothetical protein
MRVEIKSAAQHGMKPTPLRGGCIGIARNHSDILRRVKAASESDPPDIGILTKALCGTDWLVAAVAAERIGQIRYLGFIN